VELEDMYVVLPTQPWPAREYWEAEAESLPDGYRYTSDTNPLWLTPDQLRLLVNIDLDA
jgi:UDP-N-acetylglucosamine 4,6-dehydratase/5-epimerase